MSKEGTITRITLTEMGHPQEATELTTDKSTTNVIINDNVQQKRSTPMDMRLYWITDLVKQGQLKVG
jgi:hypothetical protein